MATVVRAEKPSSVKPGAKAIVNHEGVLTGWIGGSCSEPAVKREAARALLDGKPRLLRLCAPESLGQAPQEGVIEEALTCISGGTYEIYLEPQGVFPHLVVVGHLATAQALLSLGKALGYTVTLMGQDASSPRFAEADQVIDKIDFSQIKSSPNTFIVVASHGNYDEEALMAALQTGAPYVSLIASHRRAQAVLQYLHDAELAEGWEARLKYPAGLDIGAETAEEIALSILGEIVQIHRRELRERSGPGTAASKAIEIEFALDPVCGMRVEIENALHTLEHGGRAYYFCAAGCKHAFRREPERYLIKE